MPEASVDEDDHARASEDHVGTYRSPAVEPNRHVDAKPEAVSVELAALAMPHARIVVEVAPADELGPHGADTVALLLAPHSGSDPLPLGKGASGGELSRVMLALEVVLAARTDTGSVVSAISTALCQRSRIDAYSQLTALHAPGKRAL